MIHYVGKVARPLVQNFSKASIKFCARQSSQYYKIDENIYGLNDQQKELRQLVFNFAQKELAPKANEIDRTNNFDDLRVGGEEIEKGAMCGSKGVPLSETLFCRDSGRNSAN